MILTLLSIAWLGGIWLGALLPLPWEGMALVCVSVVSMGLLWKRPGLLLAGASLAALVLGDIRYQSSVTASGTSSLASYYGRGSVEVAGELTAEPELRNRTSHLRLDVSAVRAEGEWQPAAGTVLLIGPRYPEHSYGERVLATGRLEAPEPFEGFDYPGYLARQGIYSVMTFPKIQVVHQGGGLPAWGWLLSAKRRLADNLARVLPEPQASLAQGMLLGIRSAIPQDLMDSFSRSGTAHIIVISGQNLTLLAGYVLSGGQALIGRRRAVWLSLASILLYTLLVGAQPPVVRALIMSSIFILGAHLGRQREASIGLALAAALMAGLQPSLLWDVSFQLSFGATAGLIFIAPVLYRAVGGLWASTNAQPASPAIRIRKYVVESLAVTMAATAAILPLLLINFERFSLVAPVANLLLLPALPGIMLTGALAAGLGSLPLAGPIAGWIAWPFLTYLTSLVRFLGDLPIASLEAPGFEFGLAVAYYSALCLCLLWRPLTSGSPR